MFMFSQQSEAFALRVAINMSGSWGICVMDNEVNRWPLALKLKLRIHHRTGILQHLGLDRDRRVLTSLMKRDE